MSEETRQDDMSKKTVVYRAPGMDAVTVRRDVEYRAGDAGPLAMDLYEPPGFDGSAKLPAVVIVAGYPDPGFEKFVGCRFKEMGSSVSWGRLIAASGLVAITYTNREPAADLQALLQFVRGSAASLGIDESRVGLWASSGNVPLALWALMEPGRDLLRCAALCYGLTLDLDGATDIAELAATYRFANPGAGKPVDDLPRVPLFLARAGQDQFPHLNEAMDRFVSKALSRNLPLTLVNHPEGPHAFDLLHDSGETREIVREILGFLAFHLRAREG